MKRAVIAPIFITATLITMSSVAAASEKPLLLAANTKYKTTTHKVYESNCEKMRQQIMNRCLYKYKMSRTFCNNQDTKNAAVCADLRKKAANYKKEQAKKVDDQKAADERFDSCVRMAGCDSKTDEQATKWCYDDCKKRTGY